MYACHAIVRELVLYQLSYFTGIPISNHVLFQTANTYFNLILIITNLQ